MSNSVQHLRQNPVSKKLKPPANDFNKLGNSEIAAAAHFIQSDGDNWRWDCDQGRWFCRNGALWEKQTPGAAFDALKHIIVDEFGGVEKTCKASFIAGAETIAKKSNELEVTSDIWDADPYVLGTPDALIDLRSFNPDRPSFIVGPSDHFVTQSASCNMCNEPNSTPKLWLQFLQDSTGGDNDLIRFLQQISGYLLTGDTSEHAMFMIYGAGGNGKSVFLNTICRILGDYSKTAGMDLFMQTKQDRHPTEWAGLRGARLVSASETQEGRTWAENRIKQATGGDPITARFMRQDEFTYIPRFKLIIIGNHEPNLKNVDDAIKRRFSIIPFTKKPSTVDKDLEQKLVAEHSQILRWMIEGCRDWIDHGLIRPQSVIKQTGLYFAEQDILGRWMEECCELADNCFSTSLELFQSWNDFVDAEREKVGTRRSFSQALAKRGIQSVRQAGGDRTRGYEGITLKNKDGEQDNVPGFDE